MKPNLEAEFIANRDCLTRNIDQIQLIIDDFINFYSNEESFTLGLGLKYPQLDNCGAVTKNIWNVFVLKQSTFIEIF